MNSIYDIWFARVDVANSIKFKLYKNFSTKEIFQFTKQDFLDNNLKEISIEKFMLQEYRLNLEKYLEYMYKNNILQIFYKDKMYPEKLKKILDFPTYIFVRRKC